MEGGRTKAAKKMTHSGCLSCYYIFSYAPPLMEVKSSQRDNIFILGILLIIGSNIKFIVCIYFQSLW
jgi:hypothetical protein